MPTCPTCHANLMENARFCTQCGARISAAPSTINSAATTNAVQTAPPGTQVAATVPSAGATPHPAISTPPQPAVSAPQATRTSSRTIAIAGLLLCLLFFSPFISCGGRTWTGAQAFQDSLPSQYEEPKDGIVLILLPIAGLAGIVVGLIAMTRVDRGSSLGVLRGLGIAALLTALLAACPLGVALYDVNRSDGMFELEWGFWGSALAMLAMGWGALGLVRTRREAG